MADGNGGQEKRVGGKEESDWGGEQPVIAVILSRSNEAHHTDPYESTSHSIYYVLLSSVLLPPIGLYTPDPNFFARAVWLDE